MRLGYAPLSAGIVHVDEAFAVADRLGLELVELSYDLVEALPSVQSAASVDDLSRATGIETTVHLSYVDLNLASVSPVARQASVRRTLDGIEYAAAIRARCGVIHLGAVPLSDPRAMDLALAALDESLTALADSPVPLAAENLGLSERDLPDTPSAMAEALSRHGIGACLDVGHAHVQTTREGSDAWCAYLAAVGDRIIHLHLHDNLGDRDAHLPVGEGSVPLASWLHALPVLPDHAVLEIESNEAGVAASVRRVRALLDGGPW